LDKDFAAGLSVSPDGRWLPYSQVDEENSDISSSTILTSTLCS